MVEIDDILAIQQLVNFRDSIKEDTNILDEIRRSLNKKPVVYQPFALNSIDDITSSKNLCHPMVALFKAGASYQYGVITIYRRNIFDGLCRTPVRLTMKNLYNTIDQQNYYEKDKKVELIKGYMFIKTGSARRKSGRSSSSNSSSGNQRHSPRQKQLFAHKDINF